MGGYVAVGDRQLGSAQLATGDAGLQGRGLKDAGTLGGGDAANHLAGGDLRQQGGLLVVRAGQHHRLGQEIDRGGERDRRHGAAEFLGDHAEFQVPQAEAAMFFRDRRAQPALPGHGLPEGGVIGDLVVVQHLPHLGGRSVGIEELARLVLQELLVV